MKIRFAVIYLILLLSLVGCGGGGEQGGNSPDPENTVIPSLLVQVTDSTTGLGITGVKVQSYTDLALVGPVEAYGEPVVKIENTDSSGIAKFLGEKRPEAEGQYWITLSREGYETVVMWEYLLPQYNPEISLNYELRPRPTEFPITNKYKGVYDTLKSNPPSLGPITEHRAAALAQLDDLLAPLIVPANVWDLMEDDVREFYYMMQKDLISELDQNYPTVKIWKLYNMAVLIKEGDTIIAVDLTNDVFRLVGDELLSRLDAIFITHEHRDHLDSWLVRDAVALGVPVYMNSETITSGFADHAWRGHDLASLQGAVGLVPDETVSLNGWSIIALPGNIQKDAPTRSYVITTPAGKKIVHFGDGFFDASSSTYVLADFAPVDYLISGVYLSYDPESYASELDPAVFIPAHLQELSHHGVYYTGPITPYSDLFGFGIQENMYFLHYGESLGGE